MSNADSNANYILLVVFACIGLALALAIFQSSKEEIPESRKNQENNTNLRGNIRHELLDPKFMTQKPNDNSLSDTEIQGLFNNAKLKQSEIKALGSHLELLININKNKNN
jgi:Na+-translocating ferredoxin:NAD+ oxidoreductase RnfG subunit